MTALSLGDLSQSYFLRQRQTELKSRMQRLTAELASGQVADSRKPPGGSHGYLADIEIKMARLNTYRTSTNEAAQLTAALQATLGTLTAQAQNLSEGLLAAGTTVAGLSIADAAPEARNALAAMVAAINNDTAGRYALSGIETNQPPLADADLLLSALSAAITGAPTPEAMLAAARLWFDDPGGFDAAIYQGSLTALSPLSLSRSETVDLPLTARDPVLKEMLMLAAVAALGDSPAFDLSVADQSRLYAMSGEGLLGARDRMIALQARTGSAEARIERALVRNAAEMSALEMARSDLLAIDPFEAATRLEEVQFQLQSLYSVTVRNAQLSLANFL